VQRTEQDARDAYRRFQERYEAKYPSAVASLLKDVSCMFYFYKYPAEHWPHIRSTNTIESAFSTVRLRTAETRGQGTMTMTLAMVFKLAERAQHKWRKLRGHQLIQKVFDGVKISTVSRSNLPLKIQNTTFGNFSLFSKGTFFRIYFL
jgi:putative transposase